MQSVLRLFLSKKFMKLLFLDLRIFLYNIQQAKYHAYF